MNFCTHPTEMSGTCDQQVFDNDNLRLLRKLLGGPILTCYYHTKVALELTQRPHEFLTAEELGATMGGRAHGDGRRLDQYVIDQRLAMRGRR